MAIEVNNMKIGVIGYGVVGKAAENTLKKSYDVIKYDKYQDLNSFEELKICEFVFIMVPTPFDCQLNLVNLSAINESLNKLSNLDFTGTVIIKSTIPPKTTDSYLDLYDFNIVFNPEFLRESTTPNEDFENQDTVVIGTSSDVVFNNVKGMFSRVLVSNAKYYHTSAREAEMIKTAQNAMLASRVALANMVYDACLENDIDYIKVKKVAFDSFDILGPHMTQVPGPDGERGFGGKCLPKDIRAFSTIHNSKLLDSIIGYNDSLRDDLDKFLMNFKK